VSADQLGLFGGDHSSDQPPDNNPAALLALMSSDPSNLPHVRAIAAVINDTVRVGDTFSANDIRKYLPGWIKTPVVGPTFGLLRRRGAIELVGYEPSSDPRTHYKVVARYRLVSQAKTS
jgi:hypothetical protein